MQSQNYILYFGLAMLALLVLKILYAPREITEVVLPPVTEEEPEGELEENSEVIEGMSCGCNATKQTSPMGYYPGSYDSSMNLQMLPQSNPLTIPEGIDFKQEHPNLNTMDSYPAPVKGAVWSSKQLLPEGEFDLPEKYPLLSQ